MGNKNNGAHTVRLAPYLLLCLVQAIPQLPLCGFFRLLIPLPLLLVFFLPSSTLFHAKQRGLVALAATALLHIASITDHMLFATAATLQIWGGWRNNFSLLPSLNSLLAGQWCTHLLQMAWIFGATFLSTNP